jgi:hypothetical protein
VGGGFDTGKERAESPGARVDRVSLKLEVAVVIVAACLVLGAASTLIDPTRIYVNSQGATNNDQVNHIGMGRTLADTGHLASTLVYPATLGDRATKTYVYMPGYYWLAAALYRVFGYSDFVAMLPSMLGYVASAVLLLLTGRRISGAATGRIAAFLYLVFPAGVIYALSAMTDTAFATACLLSFCVFVHLPARSRPFVAPLLLLVAFLVRETGALLALPMVVFVLWEEGTALRVRLTRAATLLALSIVLLAGVLRSPVASGRPALQSVAVFTENWDAYSSDVVAYRAVTFDWSRLPDAFVRRASTSVMFVRYGRGMAAVAMRLMLLGMPLGLVLFAWRREPLGLATAGYVAITAVLHVFHFFWGPIGVRMLLSTLPFTTLVVARLAVLGTEPLLTRGFRRGVVIVAAVLAATLVTFEAVEVGGALWWYRSVGVNEDADAAFVESLHHDDRRLLAAPWDLALPYVHRHYPVKWAYLPANAPSLDVLMKRFDVGTVVVPEGHPLEDALPAAGFALEARRPYRGRTLMIWKSRG